MYVWSSKGAAIDVSIFSDCVTDLCPEQSNDWTWAATVWGLLQADANTNRMKTTHVESGAKNILWISKFSIEVNNVAEEMV